MRCSVKYVRPTVVHVSYRVVPTCTFLSRTSPLYRYRRAYVEQNGVSSRNISLGVRRARPGLCSCTCRGVALFSLEAVQTRREDPYKAGRCPSLEPGRAEGPVCRGQQSHVVVEGRVTRQLTYVRRSRTAIPIVGAKARMRGERPTTHTVRTAQIAGLIIILSSRCRPTLQRCV